MRASGYKDLIGRFTAERFDPQQWAELFRRAGARFVVPVAEHHDGFAMYDCSRSEWTAARRGPRRDVTGELAAAVRARQMVSGVSSHRAEHWWFFNGGMAFLSDVRDPAWAALYGPARPEDEPPTGEFLQDWLLRTCGPVSLLGHDIELERKLDRGGLEVTLPAAALTELPAGPVALKIESV